MSALNDSQVRGSIAKVNFMLLGVTFYGVAAYFLWPSSKEWWMWAYLSIVCALAAVILLWRALRMIWLIYRRDKVFEAYRQKGGEQKASRMASDEALKNAGMIDG
ncbi:MAG: hypothetical protein AAGK79_16000 [Pseudomonadota bacterium]